MIFDGALWLVATTKAYSDLGADVVMESLHSLSVQLRYSILRPYPARPIFTYGPLWFASLAPHLEDIVGGKHSDGKRGSVSSALSLSTRRRVARCPAVFFSRGGQSLHDETLIDACSLLAYSGLHHRLQGPRACPILAAMLTCQMNAQAHRELLKSNDQSPAWQEWVFDAGSPHDFAARGARGQRRRLLSSNRWAFMSLLIGRNRTEEGFF